MAEHTEKISHGDTETQRKHQDSVVLCLCGSSFSESSCPLCVLAVA
jgi:hypothetical protein